MKAQVDLRSDSQDSHDNSKPANKTIHDLKSKKDLKKPSLDTGLRRGPRKSIAE
jgi:hypothetical protein